MDLAGEAATEALSAAKWADEGAMAPMAAEPTDAVAPAPAMPADFEGQTVPGGPPGWTLTGRGSVFTPRFKKAGRLTGWGSNKSMKCDFHSRCSLAKPKAAVTEGKLLVWLAVGGGPDLAPPEYAAIATSISHAEQHNKFWNELCRKAARSSGDRAAAWEAPPVGPYEVQRSGVEPARSSDKSV